MRHAPSASARFTVLATLLAFLVAWILSRSEPLRLLDFTSLDRMTRLRTHFQAPPDPRIAIILFDDDSETRLAAWPVDRQWHADFMRLVYQASPAAICWDVIFDANGKTHEGDAAMAAIAGALCESKVPVVCAAVSSSDSAARVPAPGDGPTESITHITGDISRLEGHDRAFLPYPGLRAATTFAFADCSPEADGIRRRIPLLIRVGDKVYPSLGLQAALTVLNVEAKDLHVALGDAITFKAQDRNWRIPISSSGKLWVNYRYDQSQVRSGFPIYSYGKLMIGLDRHFAQGDTMEPVPDLKGKILLIGQTVTGKADAGPTPLGSLSPFTLYHANVANNILHSDYTRIPPPWVFWPAAAIVSAFALLTVSKRRVAWLVAVSIGGIALYLASATAAWIVASVWLPLSGPLLGFSLSSMYTVFCRVRDEQRAKEKVRGMFGSYLSPELLEKMISGGATPEVQSERRPVSILFSDLRDFTAWSERTPEHILIAQLNEYLAVMVGCVHEERGTLHKFIGDAVMAVWGDLEPLSPEESCTRTCRAALLMQRRLQELNRDWQARGLDPFRMGIGINHGTVLVGNIGSPRRMEFTVIGDAVNLASRLESMNKALGTSILVGKSVETLISSAFRFTHKGDLSIKGKADDIPVYELLAATPPNDARTDPC